MRACVCMWVRVKLSLFDVYVACATKDVSRGDVKKKESTCIRKSRLFIKLLTIAIQYVLRFIEIKQKKCHSHTRNRTLSIIFVSVCVSLDLLFFQFDSSQYIFKSFCFIDIEFKCIILWNSHYYVCHCQMNENRNEKYEHDKIKENTQNSCSIWNAL